MVSARAISWLLDALLSRVVIAFARVAGVKYCRALLSPCFLARSSWRDRLAFGAVRAIPPGVCSASPVQICEKRKPKYTSCALKSTLPYKTLRQTQTPTVIATPQLLSSLQCQIKGTCSNPTPKCTSELLLFSPDATVTRNRSTRTKDGTQPRNTGQNQSPRVATVSLALGDTAV